MRKIIRETASEFVGALVLSVALSAIAGAGEALDPDVLGHHMLDSNVLDHHMLDHHLLNRDALDHDGLSKNLSLIADPFGTLDIDSTSAIGGLSSSGPAAAPAIRASTTVGSTNGDPAVASAAGAPKTVQAVTSGEVTNSALASAPEIDPASAMGALTLLGAGLAVIRGRRVKN